MAHYYEIKRNRAGEFVAYFKYNSEAIWWSEGYSTRAGAANAIKSMNRNGPHAKVVEEESDEISILERIENAPIPAADRVVTLDHNSTEFKEFSGALERLTNHLGKANDTGGFSSEEMNVVKTEVAELAILEGSEPIRPAQQWLKARSTLFWIISKASGAVIETLAVVLLLAVAKLLGVPLDI